METLLIGLDGASHAVLGPLFDGGRTPTLQRVFEEGASDTLESQVPPWTASAWPSLYTGTNPGKHGVFGFLSFEGYDWDVVNASHVKEPTLWELLDRHGLTSVVVNAPVTHPPPAIDGAVVPGYTAPEDPRCQPPGLLEELREAIGDYRVYAASEGDDRVSRSALVGECVALARLRGEAFRYLVDRIDPDFGFLQFQVTDTVVHETTGDRDAVAAVYEAVDEEVGAVLDACRPLATLVVSDHGLGPCGPQVRVNEVLRREGYVRARRGGPGMPTWATVRDRSLRTGAAPSADPPGPLARLLSLAARGGVTTQQVGALLERLGLVEAVQRHVPDGWLRTASEQVDFAASRAYVRSRVECGVRVNLEGREPAGVVPAADYEAVRDDLVECLGALRDPDGRPVFEHVARREDYFSGPEAARAVDVVTVPRGFEPYLTTWLLGELFAETGPYWDHKLEGVIAATGLGIDPNADLGGAHLLDVAPTVLARFGLPMGDRMDGRVLPLAEPCGERTYPRRAEESVATADPAVASRLADLGYLEEPR